MDGKGAKQLGRVDQSFRPNHCLAVTGSIDQSQERISPQASNIGATTGSKHVVEEPWPSSTALHLHPHDCEEEEKGVFIASRILVLGESLTKKKVEINALKRELEREHACNEDMKGKVKEAVRKASECHRQAEVIMNMWDQHRGSYREAVKALAQEKTQVSLLRQEMKDLAEDWELLLTFSPPCIRIEAQKQLVLKMFELEKAELERRVASLEKKAVKDEEAKKTIQLLSERIQRTQEELHNAIQEKQKMASELESATEEGSLARQQLSENMLELEQNRVKVELLEKQASQSRESLDRYEKDHELLTESIRRANAQAEEERFDKAALKEKIAELEKSLDEALQRKDAEVGILNQQLKEAQEASQRLKEEACHLRETTNRSREDAEAAVQREMTLLQRLEAGGLADSDAKLKRELLEVKNRCKQLESEKQSPDNDQGPEVASQDQEKQQEENRPGSVRRVDSRTKNTYTSSLRSTRSTMQRESAQMVQDAAENGVKSDKPADGQGGQHPRAAKARGLKRGK
ncbi:hypothetical protein IE53DRAFT_370752 [Violaceomyces palustris]|uniref:Uncharacterized protein n=1 Tax=Violaceomyces palustris TaxID=1673888 RepID=A0ACD0NR32_9BASI|nr:hypothetical protein IE53DRAFT_370752 [Violaceomyces palustris]